MIKIFNSKEIRKSIEPRRLGKNEPENTTLQAPQGSLSFQTQENTFEGLFFPILHNIQLRERAIPLSLSLCHQIHASVATVVQLLSCVRLFVTSWTAAGQALLFFTISWSLLKYMSKGSVHLILRHPLLLLPTVFTSIGVFSNDSALCIK